MRSLFLLPVLLGACSADVFVSSDGAAPGDGAADGAQEGGPDASSDGRARMCDPNAPFGNPTPLGGLSAAASNEGHARLVEDGLTVFFATRVGGSWRLFRAQREKLSDPFAAPTELAIPPNEPASSNADTIAPQVMGGELFFSSDRFMNTSYIFVGSGPNFGNVTRINLPNASGPWVLPGVMVMYFSSQGFLVRAQRQGQTWTPSNLGELKTNQTEESFPVVTPDERRIYWSRGTGGVQDIWTATRSRPSDPWSNPAKVNELSTIAAEEHPTWVSPDDCVLLIQRKTLTDFDVLFAQRPK